MSIRSYSPVLPIIDDGAQSNVRKVTRIRDYGLGARARALGVVRAVYLPVRAEVGEKGSLGKRKSPFRSDGKYGGYRPMPSEFASEVRVFLIVLFSSTATLPSRRPSGHSFISRDLLFVSSKVFFAVGYLFSVLSARLVITRYYSLGPSDSHRVTTTYNDMPKPFVV